MTTTLGVATRQWPAGTLMKMNPTIATTTPTAMAMEGVVETAMDAE